MEPCENCPLGLSASAQTPCVEAARQHRSVLCERPDWPIIGVNDGTWLTVPAAARLLKVTQYKVRDMIKKGLLEAATVWHQWEGWCDGRDGAWQTSVRI